MAMDEHELDAWGTEFMTSMDDEILKEGNEEVRTHWAVGDVPEVMHWAKEKYPELTEQQTDWLADWLAETDS